MLRTLSAWIFAAVFLFNTFGFEVLYQLERAALHEQAEQRIRMNPQSAQLQLITVSLHDQAQPEWLRDGYEFRYNDRLYDVIRIQKQGDVVRYYCLGDDDETAFADNASQLGQQQYSAHSTGKLLKQFLLLSYFPQTAFTFTLTPPEAVAYPFRATHYTFAFSRLDIPPPRTTA